MTIADTLALDRPTRSTMTIADNLALDRPPTTTNTTTNNVKPKAAMAADPASPDARLEIPMAGLTVRSGSGSGSGYRDLDQSGSGYHHSPLPLAHNMAHHLVTKIITNFLLVLPGR